jgi:succinoglycan biosynthesis transport protein ExoP
VELKQYFELLVRWLWLLVLGTFLGAVSAFVASSLQHPVYQATSTLLISQAPSNSASVDYTALVSNQSLASTYLQLITTRPVLDAVVQKLGLTESAATLATAIQVSVVNGTQLIKVAVEDRDPQRAADIANTLPAVFSDYNQAQQASRYADSKQSLQTEITSVEGQIADLQRQIDVLGNPPPAAQQAAVDQFQAALNQLRQSRTTLLASLDNIKLAEAQSTNSVIVVETAIVPSSPIRPKRLQNTALAAVVGLMLAVGVAFLVEYLDDTIKTPAQVDALLGLPVVGVLARLPQSELDAGPIAKTEPRSPTTEAFRGLRTNLQYSSVDKPLRRLLITSAGPGEGKSTVVANLAIVMAQAGLRVAVVDADLRRPGQHKLLGRPNKFGLSESLIQDTLQLNGALQPVDIANLQLMTTGAVPPNPAELLGSKKMGSLIELVGEQVDRVIIDSPPISAVTDAVVLANQVDGVLLVVEAGKTRSGTVLQAKEQLERVGANLVGVVLNKVPIGRDGYYYSYYYSYYNSYYEEDGARQRQRRGLLSQWFPRRHSHREHAAEPAAAPQPGPDASATK